MTPVRSKSTRQYRPDPSRWWIRHAAAAWPAASGLWTHLGDSTLGKARPGTLPEIDVSAVSDLIYLPPVSAENEEAAAALAGRLAAASVPVVRQCEPSAVGGEGRVLDPLGTLLRGGARALDGLVTECESAVWPLISGLTASPAIWQSGLDSLAAAGVRVVVPQTIELGPGERRELAEFTDDNGYQALFHGSPPDEREFVRAATERGLATTPERPPLATTRRLEFCRRAATELIVVADFWLRLERSEAAGQNLLRAARWAEEFEHDLRAVAREGNLAVLPWLDRNARQVVADLAADRPSALRQALEAEYSKGE